MFGVQHLTTDLESLDFTEVVGQLYSIMYSKSVGTA